MDNHLTVITVISVLSNVFACDKFLEHVKHKQNISFLNLKCMLLWWFLFFVSIFFFMFLMCSTIMQIPLMSFFILLHNKTISSLFQLCYIIMTYILLISVSTINFPHVPHLYFLLFITNNIICICKNMLIKNEIIM